MLKLSVKLSFLISALDVCITLVESFMRQTNLNKLKLFTTGGQTIAQHQMSSMSLLEVFFVKQLYPFSSLNLDWFQSLLLEDWLTTALNLRSRQSVSYLLFPKKSSAEFSVTVNSVWEIRVNAQKYFSVAKVNREFFQDYLLSDN